MFISHIPFRYQPILWLEGVQNNPSHCKSESAGGVGALGGKYTVPTLVSSASSVVPFLPH